jgi:hypothetical protein
MALIFAGILGGCASHQDGNMQLISRDQQRNFSQRFTEAYITRTPTGDWDIMLTEDGTVPNKDSDPQKPLRPDDRTLPRQYVHLRVFWRTLGQKADHPAATNASVQWCLLGDGPNEGSLLEYSGSGLVVLEDSKDGATVKVRTAWMKAITQRGAMVDPLGPSTMKGTVHAITDQDRVDALLAEMKSETGTSEAQGARDLTGQPQHLSVTP